MTAERILGMTTDDPPGDPGGKIAAVRILLAAHLATETALALLRSRAIDGPIGVQIGLVLVSGTAFVFACIPRLARAAPPLAAGLIAFTMVRYFPNVANHTFLLFLALLVLTLFHRPEPGDRIGALATLRWLAAIVFFTTGLQKLLHGTYFHGEFLSYQIATGERFANFFRLLLPVEEFARLRSLGADSGHLSGSVIMPSTLPLGTGPFRFLTMGPLIASNVVYLFEMIAPVFLLSRRTRSITTILIVLFLAGVEAGALEIMFGILFINLTLLFLRANWTGRLLPMFLAAYAYVVVVHLGWLPNWFFQ